METFGGGGGFHFQIENQTNGTLQHLILKDVILTTHFYYSSQCGTYLIE